jgi:hypothetical protein
MNPDPQHCFKHWKKVSFIIQCFDVHVLVRKKHVQNYEMPAKGMFRMLSFKAEFRIRESGLASAFYLRFRIPVLAITTKAFFVNKFFSFF